MTLNLLALGVLLFPQAAPVDWPHFQGPQGNSQVPGTHLNFEWAEEGPEILWEVEIGRGYGGPSVRDGEVFLLDREVGMNDILRVFDLATGEEIWQQTYEAKGRLNFPGSRTVPSVEAELVYTAGGLGHVACFDRESHEIQWMINMAEQYDGAMPSFGWSASPLIVGDLVIVTALGPEVGLVALDRFSGEEVWVTSSVGYSHSTPALLDLLGEPQIVFMSTSYQTSGTDAAAPTTLWSFEPSSGEVIWRTELDLTRLPIPGPLQIDNERMFLTGGYRGGSTMLRIAEEEGEYSFEELFHIDRGAQIHLPLHHEDHLYVLVNENWNNPRGRQKEGGLLCLDQTGKEVWRTGNDPFFGRGNALLLGDHILIQDGHNGVLRVAKATPEGYTQVAEANLFEIDDRRDHEMWAPMAFADGRLLIRSHEKLLCVKL